MTIAKTFSAKFVNDMEKFCVWFNKNDYNLSDIVDGENVNVDAKFIVDNLQMFTEPPRNKLHCYIKMLMDNYIIRQGDQEIDDIKGMINAFNDNKPKKIVKTVISKTKMSDMQGSEISENETPVVIERVSDIDTSDFYYQMTLPYTTKQLISVLGHPEQNQLLVESSSMCDIDYRYEWKVTVDNTVYSVYDWRDSNGFSLMETTEWHVCTREERCKSLDKFTSYIQNCLRAEAESVRVCNIEPTNMQGSEDPDVIDLPVTYDFTKSNVVVDLDNIELDLDDLTFE